eukprot:82053-Amorphochlora_amoeboformis.AAC.1
MGGHEKTRTGKQSSANRTKKSEKNKREEKIAKERRAVSRDPTRRDWNVRESQVYFQVGGLRALPLG